MIQPIQRSVQRFILLGKVQAHDVVDGLIEERAARHDADAGLARECIEGLAEPYRTVSVLYFMQEWPVEAIARQLGRMPKTVHTQLYRAKKMLRRELAAVG